MLLSRQAASAALGLLLLAACTPLVVGTEQQAAAAGGAATVAASAAAGSAERSAAEGRRSLSAAADSKLPFLPFSEEFQHPLTASDRRREAREVAVQAHAAMQRWLAAYFRSPASRLTSTRLEEQRRARLAAEEAEQAASRAAVQTPPAPTASSAAGQSGGEGKAGDGTTAAGNGTVAAVEVVPHPAAEVQQQAQQQAQQQQKKKKEKRLPEGWGGFANIPRSGDPACDWECARRGAEQLLVEHETLGTLLRLRWPRSQADQRRWAALPPGELAGNASIAGAEVGSGGRGSINGSSGSSNSTGNSSTAGSNTTASPLAEASSISSSAAVPPSPPAPTCLPRQPGEVVRKEYLLVVPVGNDIANVLKWIDQPESATFDLVLLHYGNAASPPSCLACAAVLHMAGPKWHLLWQATHLPGWQRLREGKRAVMVADDDLLMDTCTINRAFEVFSAYGLLLGQPSLCPTAQRPSWYLHLVREPSAVLRFVTMVEIMAPIMDMGFFEEFARHSLHDAYTGWGLDFVWTFLLQFPRDRVAVIDDVCMTHVSGAQGKAGEGSVYAALAKVAPFDSREEEARRDAQYNYFPSELRALGFPYRPIEIVGIVPQPPAPPLPPGAEANLTSAQQAAGGEGSAASGAAGQKPHKPGSGVLARLQQQRQQQLQRLREQQPGRVQAKPGAGGSSSKAAAAPQLSLTQQALLSQEAAAAVVAAAKPAKPPGWHPKKHEHQLSASAATTAGTAAGGPPEPAEPTKCIALDRRSILLAKMPAPAAAAQWTRQHWLLFTQLSLMLGAVLSLLWYSGRHRRPGTPRTPRGLPLFKHPGSPMHRNPGSPVHRQPGSPVALSTS